MIVFYLLDYFPHSRLLLHADTLNQHVMQFNNVSDVRKMSLKRSANWNLAC